MATNVRSMSTGDDAVSLAAEFPVPNRQQWLRGVAGALKIDASIVDSAEPDAALAKLRSRTYDGIEIEPLYTIDDPANDERTHNGLPGFAPFVRGRSAAGTRTENWDVRQRVDASATDTRPADQLERGATSLWLDLTGLDAIDADVLGALLADVLLDVAPIELDAGSRWTDAATALVAVWERRGIAGAAARGLLGADPLGAAASSGDTSGIVAKLALVDHWAVSMAAAYPAVRTVVVDGGRYHDAGASDGQEIGFSIACGVAYLRSMTNAGLDIADAFGQLEFRVSATADQFATIAKIRALRRGWARVAEVAGVPEAAGATTIHAVTSRAMMTQYDPWVNLLRTTVACFSAGVAGADSITVLPYDAVSGSEPSGLGERLTRNTQSVLALESNLSRVIDPAGGSWYVEQLTNDIAAAAWSDFQEVEATGGFVAAVGAGLIRSRIDQAWAARSKNLATKRDAITGVTEFPNIAEVLATDTDTIADEAGSGAGLPRRRYAASFEALRHRVDRDSTTRGRRHTVFLAALGDASTATARLTYAKNLFETAGIVTAVGPASADIADVAAAFSTSGATIACLCSSDAVYGDLGADAARAMKAAGATHVYLAGRPRDLMEQLSAAGVDVSIYTGCDVEQTLTELLSFLGVL